MTEEEKKERARKRNVENYMESCRLEGQPRAKHTMRTRNGVTLQGVTLELGRIYYIPWSRDKILTCKLIQVTPLGFNLLDLETDRCILRRHLYVPKKYREQYEGDKKFFLASDHIRFLTHEEAKRLTIEKHKRKARKNNE